LEENSVRKHLGFAVVVSAGIAAAMGAVNTTLLAQQAPATSAPPAPAVSKPDPPRPAGPGGSYKPNDDPFPSTYKAPPSKPFAIRNATVMTAAGPSIRNGIVIVRDGRIVAVGTNVPIPADAAIVDGTGKFVTPGVIDVHSHLGVYAAPGGIALSDGNEATNPTTPQVWAEHSVWPQDPQFPRDLAGGVTTLQALPGSANLIGGRGVVLKVVPARTVQEMKFPGAKYGLKMACGENPKREYEQRGPSTRMGNVAGYRDAWIKAERYRRKWDQWLAEPKGDPPDRDLAMDTLAEVLRGNMLVQVHCYRADEMAQMIDVAKEFGYSIRSFHHGIEAYKIADLLAREGISASVWADWGAFKMEAIDPVMANAAMVHAAGARAVIHSDDASGSQRLNQEASKALAAGRAAGIALTEDDAVKWFTANAAWTLGLEDRIGTIEPGKNADLVLWSASPFSVYARAEKVWIDGALRFDRQSPDEWWRTDFELGFVPQVQKGRQ
jgi:imidazolonepropionase-like amidohydrolase